MGGVITDGSNFGVWESGILEADGPIRDGETVHITPADGRRPVKLHVQQLDDELMTWKRSFPLGLWTRTRSFALTAASAGARLLVAEDLRWLLASFIKDRGADVFLDRFTQAIKERSEILDRVY